MTNESIEKGKETIKIGDKIVKCVPLIDLALFGCDVIDSQEPA